MPSITKVDISNIALQALGARRISALTDQTPSGRAANFCYDICRRRELRLNNWNFAIARASLAADSPAPTWGRQNSFTLPTDFLKLIEDYPERATQNNDLVGSTVAFTAGFSGMKDWVIEGQAIVTNDSAPLQIRYIYDATDTTLFDSAFAYALGYAMAVQMAEELTQSNSKKSEAISLYKATIEEAKLADSIEVSPADPPPDSWLTARN